MTPTEIVYGLFLGAIAAFILWGASNWALEKHHAREAAKYRRAEAKHHAQIWQRAAQTGLQKITLTIKNGDEQ